MRNMKRGIFLLGAALMAGVLGACSTEPEPAATPSTVTSVTTETQTFTTSVQADAGSPIAEGPLTTMGSGTWVGGTDIAAGTYSTPGPQDASAGCAYTYLPRPGASITEATGGNTFFGPGYMDVAQGQVVQTINCTWTLQ